MYTAYTVYCGVLMRGKSNLISFSAAKSFMQTFFHRQHLDKRLHLPSLTELLNSDPLSKASLHVNVKQSCGNRERLCQRKMGFSQLASLFQSQVYST